MDIWNANYYNYTLAKYCCSVWLSALFIVVSTYKLCFDVIRHVAHGVFVRLIILTTPVAIMMELYIKRPQFSLVGLNR